MLIISYTRRIWNNMENTYNNNRIRIYQHQLNPIKPTYFPMVSCQAMACRPQHCEARSGRSDGRALGCEVRLTRGAPHEDVANGPGNLWLEAMVNGLLVGGWATPLKNDQSQLG